MGILNKLFKKENKFIQPQATVVQSGEDTETVTAQIEDGCSYQSTWFSDPSSPTGRKYLVRITSPHCRVEGSGVSMELAMSKANKEYYKHRKR